MEPGAQEVTVDIAVNMIVEPGWMADSEEVVRERTAMADFGDS